MNVIARVDIDDGEATGPELVNGRPQIRSDYGDGCYSAIDIVGETILPALTEALKAGGGKLPEKVKDAVAFHLWTTLARAIDHNCIFSGFESFFEGEVFYPEAITELSKRITAANSTPAGPGSKAAGDTATTNPKPAGA
jgi:hypothetical protein